MSQDTPCPKTIHLLLALGLRPERLEVGVFSSNFDEKMIIRKKMNAQFAPTIYMTIPLASTGILTPGTYQLDVKLTGDTQEWSFEDDFTISENQVKEMKKTVPDVEEHPNSFLGENSKALMIGSFLIIILLLGYIYRLKRSVSS